MQDVLKKWTDALLDWLGATSEQHDDWDRWVAVALVLAAVVLFDFVCRFIAVHSIRRVVLRTKITWDDELFSVDVLNRACHILSAVLLWGMLPVVFDDSRSGLHTFVVRLVQSYAVFTVFRFVSALLYASFRIVSARPAWQNKPIKGLRQTAQGIALFICVILIVSILMDKSPAILFTGLGASAAIVMLIFKDSILGFVSGIQLSANDMLKVGDWIQMSKYGADGTVIEVTLTTVKVRNWDNTIVTLPPYVLVSDSFQNWQAMKRSGGRRVMRSIAIDMNSVRFCTPEMLDRYRRIALAREHIDAEEKRLEARKTGDAVRDADLSRQTNLGIFRGYLVNYLRREVPVNPDMTLMVRQLQPTDSGLPLQLYFFTNTVDWITYEGIQSDVFDHLLAVVREFDLRVFQRPAGYDVELLRGALPSEQAHEHDLDDDHAQEHADGVDRGV